MRDEENLCAETGQLGAVPTENRTGRPDKSRRRPIRHPIQRAKNTESAPRKASIKFAGVMLSAGIGRGCRKSEAILTAP